jgi:hypothetical protein
MRRPIHELRVATLVVAPLLAALTTLTPRNERVMHATAPALVILWTIMAAALILRLDLEAHRRSPAAPPTLRTSILAQLDVLTATGSSVMWTSVAALLGAALTGWASLSVLGVLGLAAVYLAATWTALVAGGRAPWRRATITRAIVPALAVEGDPLREEVRLTGVRIPAGMQLFATGRTTRHGAITRYAIGSEGSLSEIKLESELGAATRGEHQAPPLALWLGDVLGLTRTPVVEHGAASFVVLPRPAVVRGARALLGLGGDDAVARSALRQPSEGSFRIREYLPGDDTRRIHWVRSLQMSQLMMRLPDELPPADPEVRLILDSDLWGTGSLSCRAPRSARGSRWSPRSPIAAPPPSSSGRWSCDRRARRCGSVDAWRGRPRSRSARWSLAPPSSRSWSRAGRAGSGCRPRCRGSSCRRSGGRRPSRHRRCGTPWRPSCRSRRAPPRTGSGAGRASAAGSRRCGTTARSSAR